MYITYLSFTIFILDLIAYAFGLLMVRRLKVGLDRTLKLALSLTGIAILLKTIFNVLLFYTDAGEQTELPMLIEIVLWNTQNKAIGLINVVFLILVARCISIILAF